MIWKYPPIEQVRRINRTWIVRDTLAADTDAYLSELEKQNPALLLEVCTHALEAARRASHEQRDPKPDFYASLFRRATPAERERYLSNHPWTLKLLSESTVC